MQPLKMKTKQMQKTLMCCGTLEQLTLYQQCSWSFRFT